MQTIARANRIYDDEKTLGLIVDYGNVYKQLEYAYSIYGEGSNNQSGGSSSPEKPTKDIEQLVQEIKFSILDIKKLLSNLSFELDMLTEASPVEKLKLIQDAINSICQNERTKAEFEIKAKLVINKFNALYPETEVKQFGKEFDAIEAIYRSLNQEVKKTDITEVMKKLQDHVGKYIEIKKDNNRENVEIDLSKLDFEKLKEVFKKKDINKSVFDLKDAIDKKLNDTKKS